MCFKDEYKFRQSYISSLEYIKENWKKNECKSFSLTCLNLGSFKWNYFCYEKIQSSVG